MRVEAGHIIEAKMVQKHPSRPICLIPGCDMPRIKTRLTCNGIKKTWKKNQVAKYLISFLLRFPVASDVVIHIAIQSILFIFMNLIKRKQSSKCISKLIEDGDNDQKQTVVDGMKQNQFCSTCFALISLFPIYPLRGH